MAMFTDPNAGESLDVGYVSAIDLAHVLKVTDAEIAKLARSAVLVRVSHPQDSRAFLDPLLENVTRYVTHLRSAKEKCYLGYIREKSKLQKIQRVRAELKHGLESGVMVEFLRMMSGTRPQILPTRSTRSWL